MLCRGNPNNASACRCHKAFASFSRVGNLLTVKAILLGTIKGILASEHWVSIARIREILKARSPSPLPLFKRPRFEIKHPNQVSNPYPL
jgi:hypothetical protein